MNFNSDENIEMWDWQDEDYSLQTNSSNNLWSNLNDNQDDISYVFDETTPAKSLGDLTYQVTNNENAIKGKEACKESYSQAKRRRMLHFENEDIMPLCDEDFSSTYLKSKGREASLDGALSDMTQWVSGFADDTSASRLDESSEGWLADCLINDTEMQLSPDDVYPAETIDVQIDVSELNTAQPENGSSIVQEKPTPTRSNVIFKGKKKCLIKTPLKMASSVVLPFDFVKPCGMQGAITLKDINRKILTPPPSLNSKKTRVDPTDLYPTSAFSGKPVVGKTKIRTEGGKGSITIMRTKG